MAIFKDILREYVLKRMDAIVRQSPDVYAPASSPLLEYILTEYTTSTEWRLSLCLALQRRSSGERWR